MNRDIVIAWMAVALGLGLVTMLLDATLAFAGTVSLVLTFTLWLGAMRRDDIGPFKPYIAASFVVWIVSFAGMHLLSHSADDLVGGLPHATAVMVYGLWIAPLFTATIPYALHFDRFTLTEEEIRRVEEAVEEE